jgi:hypothetical protein
MTRIDPTASKLATVAIATKTISSVVQRRGVEALRRRERRVERRDAQLLEQQPDERERQPRRSPRAP